MKNINQNKLLDRVNDCKKKGLHVDGRLIEEIKKGGDFYIINLEEQEAFLSLIWQESDPARLLTPSGNSRCLIDVANRFIERQYTFDQLSKSMGLSTNEHQPEWFINCVSINSNFNYDDFGLVSIVPTNDGERKQSPKGSFYIYDGMHKSLVLAVKILKSEIEYHPIEALYLLPRRN